MFHNYCFAREISTIIDHKPLVAIFKKDVVTHLKDYHALFVKFTNTESG